MRSSTEAGRQLVRRLLAGHLVDGVEAPANYSLLIAPPSGRGAGGIHFLYRGTAPIVRTRDPHRLVMGLLSFLNSHAAPAPGMEMVAVGLVDREDRAVLAPYALRASLDRVERRLGSRGLRVVDTPWAVVDAGSRELVVPEPDLNLHWPALERLREVAPRPAAADKPVPPGRYPIRAWALPASARLEGPLSRGAGVLLAATLVVRPAEIGGQRCLEDLARIIGPVPPFGIRWSGPEDLVARLVDPR